MRRTALLPVVAVTLLTFMTLQAGEAWARAGGGGSRGSRSFSSPARPMPSSPAAPSSPSRSLGTPAPSSQPFQQRPSVFGGLMGGLAGFALGGLLGSLLFGGLGHGFGGGIGLFEIVLIGGGIFLLMSYLRRRRSAEAPAPAYAAAGVPGDAYGAAERGQSAYAGTATMEAPAGLSDLDRGLGHIQQMDPRFDAAAFTLVARNAFLEVQQAVAARDVSWLRDRLTGEVLAVLQAQCDRLRGAGQTNHIERIQVRRADITEAWQETGRDFVTVYLAASMLDYVTSDATGAVVEGSKTEPQDVEEFWTFARPVGNNPWQLSAIQSA
jgi:predicted lipid-binding transport protein (Tim44 family)